MSIELPFLAATTEADCYGLAPVPEDVAVYCVYDPEETDPPIAEGIIFKEWAEEIAKRCNNYPVALAVVEAAREIALQDADDVDPRLDHIYVQVDRDAWRALLDAVGAYDG